MHTNHDLKFGVEITGKTLTGVPIRWLRESAALVLKAEGDPLERMLSGRRVVVKIGLPLSAAEELCNRLQAIGLEARVVSLSKQAINGLPSPSLIQEPLPAPGTKRNKRRKPSPSLIQEPLPASPSTNETVEPSSLATQNRVENLEQIATKTASPMLAPPLSETAQVKATEQPARILGIGLEGRLDRTDYLACFLLSFLALPALMVAINLAGMPKSDSQNLFLLMIFAFLIRCSALRLHDLGRSGWLSLLILVPAINVLIIFALLYMQGNDDDNDYGQAPPDSGQRRVLAVILSIFSVAMLALAAYA